MVYATVFGVVSVTIVSLLSLGGACIGPLMGKDSKHRWLHFFLSMAISTLSSDAILHIIPEVIGEHEHNHENNHNHENEHNSTEPKHGNLTIDNNWYTLTDHRKNLLLLSVVTLTIYVLYFVEFFMFYRKTHLHYCAPSTKTAITSSPVSSSIEAKTSDSYSSEKENNNNEMKSEKRRNSMELEKQREQGGHELINLRENDEDAGKLCGLKPRALIILFGDGLHNLVDGIAIGASYASSIRLGIITTIAVICHELPHEIGDLAVLIDSGLPMTRALLLNLLSALTAYLGLFIAITFESDKTVERILLAITAGMFLYVAWVDMLSHLKHDALMADHWMVASFIQILGFAVGFLLIFSLGWFENFV